MKPLKTNPMIKDLVEKAMDHAVLALSTSDDYRIQKFETSEVGAQQWTVLEIELPTGLEVYVRMIRKAAK